MRPLIRYGLGVVALSFASEVCFYAYKWCRGRKLSAHKEIVINEVLFTFPLENENEKPGLENLKRIENYLNASRISILLSMYTFTCESLANAIRKAHERGVTVRIIGDETMVYSSASRILGLIKEGIPVKLQKSADNVLMHNKFCLIDTIPQADVPRASAVIIPENSDIVIPVGGLIMSGSMNWTMQAFVSSWENIMITSTPYLVQQYHTEFFKIWNSLSA